MLTEVRAPRTAGATNESHFSSHGGILKREKRATGTIRGAMLTMETPKIRNQI